MSTPPEQPGDTNASQPKLSIEEQLDELLSKIEAADPSLSAQQVQPTTAQPTRAKAQTQAQASSAQAHVDALLDESQGGTPSQAEIDALLNGPPAEATSAEQEQEQEQMLASLNTALKDIPEPSTADEPAEELSMEERLQQEIMALLPPEPEAAAPATPDVLTDTADEEEDDDDVLAGSFESPESLAAMEAAQPPTPSTQDQIAMEIESLLAEQQPRPTAEPSETAMDELDQMLAQEIDADDELAGDFHSVEDLTAGIQINDHAGAATDDEHAATARDVAAELDSQPENLPAPPPSDATEDPFKELDEIVGKPRQNQPQRRAALQADDFKDWLQAAKERLLVACYWINWPARRFLTTEWRANLGYIALLNLFFGVGIWIVRILF